MNITAKIHAAFSPPLVRLDAAMITTGINQKNPPIKNRKNPNIASITLPLYAMRGCLSIRVLALNEATTHVFTFKVANLMPVNKSTKNNDLNIHNNFMNK